MSLYLIDTSVLGRSADPRVAALLRSLIANRSAATCATVDLEVAYSGRNATDVDGIRQRRLLDYRLLPLTEAAADRARDVQLLLARAGLHRSAGIVDLLTAAVAEQHGATLLHLDADFEHIAAVTGQTHLWALPPGSF